MIDNRSKRGISPLIATVLIIGFTIVLAALVITWGTDLFKSTVEQTETTAKFSQACSTGFRVEVVDKEYDGSAVILRLRNNNQDLAISGWTAVLNTANTSVSGVIDPEESLEFPVTKTYTITADGSGAASDLESVDLFPSFTIEGETKACETPLNIEI